MVRDINSSGDKARDEPAKAMNSSQCCHVVSPLRLVVIVCLCGIPVGTCHACLTGDLLLPSWLVPHLLIQLFLREFTLELRLAPEEEPALPTG